MSHLEAEIGALERESRQLTDLFQCIVNDMKGSTVIWEDFSSKAAKLHVALRSTIVVITPFLDAFQKVADLANGSRGATRDIGVALTRLCVRHRSIDTKLRAFSAAITDTVVEPLQMRLEEWKKTTAQMDRDHSKEYKKIQHEIKKASSDTIRLQKRSKKGQSDLKLRLDNALLDVHKKYVELEEVERQAVRSAMIEERSRFCSFLSFLKPLMEQEIGMFGEFSHLQEIVELLLEQTADPTSLPQSCEQVILDAKKGRGDTPLLKSSSSGCVMTLGSSSQVGSYRSSTCSIDSSSSGFSQSQGSSSVGATHLSNSQSTTAIAQPSFVDSNGRDDSSSSEFSSLSLTGSHSTASLHSSSTFHPFPSTPLDQSEFLHRSHTISCGRSNARPFSSFESKSDAVASATPSSSIENGNPGDRTTHRSAEVADGRRTEDTCCAQPLIDSSESQGPVDWPEVPSFVSTKQRVSSSEQIPAEEAIGGDVGRMDSSLGRPVCRSFSFPTQIESLENLDPSSSVRPVTGFQLPQQNIRHGGLGSVQSDVAETCDDETKSMTLPRMPQFKIPLVPLVPQRFSTNLSGRGRPPTLPKRTSSRLCSVRPSFPSAADAAGSGSAEEAPSTTPSTTPVQRNSSSDLQSDRDTAESETSAGGERSGRRTTDESKFSASSSSSSPGLSFSPRQQAPPSDDSDGFCPVGDRQPAVIPLTEEIAEFSGCQMQFPVDDNSITKPGELSDENTVK